MVFCPPLFSSSFLVTVFWCCPVFCCLYGVLSTIIFLFFPGHRVLVLQSFVVYIVFCPPLFPPPFLVIVFWCCPVFCCLYGVLSTIIFLFFPGHRVLVLPSLLLSIWCSVYHYFPLLSWSSCVSVAVFCCLYGVLSTIISPSFLVIVFWCCPVFCCLYGVLSTIIFSFFPCHRVLVLPSLLLSIWCSVHYYFPLLSWSWCVSVAQSFVVYMVFWPPLFSSSFRVIVFWCCPVFVVYMVFCPPLFSSSFLVIVFWCCSVFCCLYGVLSTIIFLFFPGHRVLVLPSLLLSIWCSVHHYFPILSWSSCVSVAQSFVVYMVFCPPLFSSSFLVIVC